MVASLNSNPPAASRPSLLVPLTVAGAFFMEGLDSTIIVTVLPQIAAEFGVPTTSVTTALTIYILSVAVFIPLSGWLVDRFEARRVYCAAILVFALGSILCGLSSDPDGLIAGRVVQGIGGALMMPAGRVILARTFPKDQLINAMSFMVIPALAGPMLGPVIGGFIATYGSWRWIFFVNVPLAVLAFGLALRFVQPTPVPKPTPFDFRGFMLAAVAFACLQSALDLLTEREALGISVLLFAASAATLVMYYRHARGHAAPVIDLSMLKFKALRVAVIGGTFTRIGIVAPAFLTPILLQVAFGMTAFHAGLLLFANAAGQIAMRAIMKPLFRYWSVRTVLLADAVLISVMLCGFVALSPTTPDWLIIAYLFGFGMLQCVMLSTLAAMAFSGISTELAGRATTVSAVAQRFSMAVGITLSALALNFASPDGNFTPGDFVLPFVLMAVLQALSIVSFFRLAESDVRDLKART